MFVAARLAGARRGDQRIAPEDGRRLARPHCPLHGRRGLPWKNVKSSAPLSMHDCTKLLEPALCKFNLRAHWKAAAAFSAATTNTKQQTKPLAVRPAHWLTHRRRSNTARSISPAFSRPRHCAHLEGSHKNTWAWSAAAGNHGGPRRLLGLDEGHTRNERYARA